MRKVLIRNNRCVLPQLDLLDGHGWYLSNHNSSERVCKWWLNSMKLKNNLFCIKPLDFDVAIFNEVLDWSRVQLVRLCWKTCGVLKGSGLVWVILWKYLRCRYHGALSWRVWMICAPSCLPSLSLLIYLFSINVNKVKSCRHIPGETLLSLLLDFFISISTDSLRFFFELSRFFSILILINLTVDY